jgi:hypothetical protein
MTHIRLIHWNTSERNIRADFLRAYGFMVEADLPAPPLLLKDLRSRRPDAVLIDLSRLPAQGRDIGLLLRKSASTRPLPLVFVGGEKAKVVRIRKLLPDAVYSDWESIRSAIRRAIANPPSQPVVPASVFEAYAGVSLAKKLGVKPKSVVALVNAPAGFAKKLKPLPEGVRFVRRMTRDTALTLWFNTSESNMKSGLGEIVKGLGDGRVWIVWPKKNGVGATSLSQAVVRAAGLKAGLVDYKICSLDEMWSGLLFTQRKLGKHKKSVP